MGRNNMAIGTKALQQILEGADECLCGCGGEVTDGKKFLPGHDSKALHEIIHRYYGNTEEFIVAHKHAKSGTMKRAS